MVVRCQTSSKNLWNRYRSQFRLGWQKNTLCGGGTWATEGESGLHEEEGVWQLLSPSALAKVNRGNGIAGSRKGIKEGSWSNFSEGGWGWEGDCGLWSLKKKKALSELGYYFEVNGHSERLWEECFRKFPQGPGSHPTPLLESTLLTTGNLCIEGPGLGKLLCVKGHSNSRCFCFSPKSWKISSAVC